MSYTALFGSRGDHANVSYFSEFAFHGCEARGVDAVIIGEQDLQFFSFCLRRQVGL